IQRIVEQTTCDQDLILDFFAGSGTTGHAVFAQNRKDGHNRSFLLVQLPESTGRSDYPTIAAIAKERLRRAIQALMEESPSQRHPRDLDAPEDLGFKVFRLDNTV